LNPDDEDNPLWAACCSEWGKGSGFKERVLLYLRGWSHLQTRLDAHERTDAMSLIPFLEEIARPAQAPRFTLHVRNLRALRDALWTPEPLSVLIGANGAGKTTLLQTLTFLRLAYERGLPEAVKIVFGGSGNLKSWGALPEEPVEIGLDLGEASWRIELLVDGPTLATLTNERFTVGARAIFSRDVLGNFTYGEERLDPSPLTGLRALMDRGVNEPWLRRVKSLLQSTAVYREPDLWTLREQGSRSTDNGQLHPRGTNALTLLRGWSQERAHRDRYQFVVEGLEANGVLQLLVLFCEVAAAEDESVVAIDEPENGLHPYALRRFLSRTSRWAKQHNVTVLLATHSTVLLDELSPHPEQVFVMKAAEEGEPVPTRLDKLCDPRWLAGFKLGDLYEQGEIGSNEDEA